MSDMVTKNAQSYQKTTRNFRLETAEKRKYDTRVNVDNSVESGDFWRVGDEKRLKIERKFE